MLSKSHMRAPALASLFCLLIFISHKDAHFKEKPPDSMKIPNTSETRIVSHTLCFKLCLTETEDQPKSVCVSIRNREAHQQLANVHLNLKPMYLFHVNKLPIYQFFSLLLHVSPCPSFHVGFESISLDLFSLIFFLLAQHVMLLFSLLHALQVLQVGLATD